MTFWGEPAEDPIGWWPARYDSVQFGYTVLGELSPTSIGEDSDDAIGLAPRLWSPNPLRRDATIAFSTLRAGSVLLELFDVTGRRVRVLQDGELPLGHHDLLWNGLSDKGRSLATGLYFLRLETHAGVATRKLVVLD